MRKSDPNSIRAVMSGETVGPKAAVTRAVLRVVEPFYAAAMRARNKFYDRRTFRTHKVGRPVIAFGNITTGGTGKTPMVRWAAERLRDAGLSLAILSRGYGSTEGNPLGDELSMLDEQLNVDAEIVIPVLANPDRVTAAGDMIALDSSIRVFLLDDGFQHRRIARNLNIVLINATEPFGFDHVLPRGLLREPLTGLQRADAIVLTHVNRVDAAEISKLESTLASYTRAVPIYRTSHMLSGVLTPDGPAHLDSLRTVSAFGFCGIGTPAAFDRDISELCNRVGFHAFDDHHAYAASDISMLEQEAKHAGATVLLTTEKDWTKLAPLATAPGAIPIWRMEMRIAFEADHEARLLQQMLDAIKGGTA